MGVEDYLLASSLLGVLAQRLVRRNCPACKREVDAVLPEEVGVANGGNGAAPHGDGDLPDHLATLPTYEGAGCESCSFTGYRGRSGIYELLMVSDPIRQLILKHASADMIRQEAIRLHMRTLREDGWLKVRDGTTTVSEIIRVTRD
jgi:type II secretory ATPase GspE/PulE/Tfp pilus assembly ATPase PilB-like protein